MLLVVTAKVISVTNMNSFFALTVNMPVLLKGIGCFPNRTPVARTLRMVGFYQINQASTVLEETVQGAAKVLSEAAATTKSSVDAAKKASHTNSTTAPIRGPEPSCCCRSRFQSTTHGGEQIWRTYRKRVALRNELELTPVHGADGRCLMSTPFPTRGP